MSISAFTESMRLLRTRNFGTFWFGCLLSNIGTWVQQVAQPWLLLSLGASPFLLGLDAFALAAPVFLLTLIGGALADAKNRRNTILQFQSLQMLCPVLLVVSLLTHTIEPWIVITLSLVVGITDGLSMPSFQSIVPSIVEKKQIAAGLALNATQFNLSRILGPAIAGVLIAGFGVVGAFGISALSYVPFILVALWILPKHSPTQLDAPELSWRTLRANVAEVLRQPMLRRALATVFVSGLCCAPLVMFSPILIKVALSGDVSHFSLVMGAFGVGGLLGAINLSSLSEQRDRRTICSSFAIAYGLCVTLASQCNSVWVLSLLFVLAGYTMTMSNTSANTLIQTAATSSIRGQSVSLFMLVMRGGMALGGLLTGFSIGFIGIRSALLINGLLAVLLQIAIFKLILFEPIHPSIK